MFEPYLYMFCNSIWRLKVRKISDLFKTILECSKMCVEKRKKKTQIQVQICNMLKLVIVLNVQYVSKHLITNVLKWLTAITASEGGVICIKKRKQK